MILTKGEFCQFSPKSKLQMLKEFGSYVCEHIIGCKSVSLFKVYGFYVELIYNLKSEKIEKIEPLTSVEMAAHYRELYMLS